MTRLWNARFDNEILEQLSDLANVSRRSASDIVRLLIAREHADLKQGNPRVAFPQAPTLPQKPKTRRTQKASVSA